MEDYITYEKIREYMTEWNEKILKTKLEAPNLLRKEVESRF